MNSPRISKLRKVSALIDAFSEYTGRVVSWLVLAMVLLIGWDVGMRYIFQSGSVALQELEWHLFAVIFLLGAAYTLKHDGHVRVDVFYKSRWMNPRRRAWVDIIGVLLFLIPFCLLIISGSWTFVHDSFQFAERSPDPGGLPWRWALKAMIPLGFALVLIQGISLAMRRIAELMSDS